MPVLSESQSPASARFSSPPLSPAPASVFDPDIVDPDEFETSDDELEFTLLDPTAQGHDPGLLQRPQLPQQRRRGRPRRVPEAFISNMKPRPGFDPGRCDHICTYCGARHWIGEGVTENGDTSFQKCCMKGNVELPDLKPIPEPLSTLLTEQNSRGRYYRENQRAYNMAFCLNSFRYNKDDRINTSQGIQWFQIHGTIYHF